MEIKICENIKRLRSQLGVTQEMLADYCGISSQAVSKWEMQQSLPDICVLPSIAEYFKVSRVLEKAGGYHQKRTREKNQR